MKPEANTPAGILPAAPRWMLLSVLVLFAGCSSMPQQEAAEDAAASREQDAGEEAAQAQEATPEQQPKIVAIEPVRPKIELTGGLLYRILLAEFAGHRGRLDLSLENYMELARSTRDHKIVERATRIAVYARDTEAAREAATLWVELDPLDPDPHQVLAVMELRDGNMEPALSHLQNMLDYSHGDLDQKLWMIANLLSREKDQAMIIEVMERLIDSRGDQPEALYAFAHVAARMGELERATDLLERALNLAPGNDNAVMSYIALLQRQERDKEAVTWLENALETREGNNFNLRLAYARLLTEVQRYDEARRQFEILVVQAPNNMEVLYSLGLLYLQANRLDEAEETFRRMVRNTRNTDDAHYYLGRIAQERGNYREAGIHYQAVQDGDNFFDAQIRQALILAQRGYLEQAREHLQTIETDDQEERIALVQAEAELLVEERNFHEAMEVYNQALEGGYNSDLLYSRAMLAERIDRLDILEQDLRRIIEHEPENAQALNALGYTLADRTDRYQEAYELISRALELSPGDYYILDSMGWVLYRQGKLDMAVDYLRKAMEARPDPEIAAHLGEVLWVMGDKDAAREVWDTALQQTPQDRKLLDVIERFNP